MRRGLGGPIALVAAGAVAGVVLGALGGWLWWTWWGPPPTGRIYDTDAGKAWYPDPFDPGITRDFGATATYAVVAFGLALVLGLAGAWLARRHAVAGILAVLVGAGLGVAAMSLVGQSLSPPDPNSLLASHEVRDVLPGHLHVTGWTPYLAWPVGAMLAYLVAMVAFPGRPSDRSAPPAQRSAAPAPQG